jgi:hypothetical protein
VRRRICDPLAGAATVLALAGCGPSAASRADGTAAASATTSAIAASPASTPIPAPVDTPPARPRDARVPATTSPTSGAPAAGAPSAAFDTVRGIVAVVGSEPMTQTVVRPADGARSVTVTGDAATGLRTLSGADVVVRGARTGPRELRVASFAVRTVDGVAAADGVLERVGERFSLRLADGTRRPVVRPSPALVAYLGSRVWVTGPADVEPQAFGLITP